jgi:putative transposase
MAPGPKSFAGGRHHLDPDLGGIPVSRGLLDALSRRIVGWAMETQLRTELVLEALNRPLGQRRPIRVIHHSDQGTQYTSFAFGMRCRAAGVWAVDGFVGDCFNNAMCESFLRHAGMRIRPLPLSHPVEARMAVFECVGGLYNPHHRHSTLDNLSPINYERSHQSEGFIASPPPSTKTG